MTSIPQRAASSSTAAPFLLRPVEAADGKFLDTLYRSTRETELSGVPWNDAQKAAFCTMQFNAQTASYRQTYPHAEHRVICTPEGEAAGRFIKARAGNALQLVDIALLPLYRGRGWGTLIIRALQQEAAALNLALRLSVEKLNPALALYQRLGFSLIGEDDIRYQMVWSEERQPAN